MRITDTGPIDLPLADGVARELPRIAESWVQHVQSRTRSGVDADGRRFPPKAGGGASNLHESGAMVQSFRVQRLDTNGFRLAPTGRRNLAVAHIHQARGRKWIGVDPDTVE